MVAARKHAAKWDPADGPSSMRFDAAVASARQSLSAHPRLAEFMPRATPPPPTSRPSSLLRRPVPQLSAKSASSSVATTSSVSHDGGVATRTPPGNDTRGMTASAAAVHGPGAAPPIATARDAVVGAHAASAAAAVTNIAAVVVGGPHAAAPQPGQAIEPSALSHEDLNLLAALNSVQRARLVEIILDRCARAVNEPVQGRALDTLEVELRTRIAYERTSAARRKSSFDAR